MREGARGPESLCTIPAQYTKREHPVTLELIEAEESFLLALHEGATLKRVESGSKDCLSSMSAIAQSRNCV